MRKEKRRRLEKKGWKVGSVEEFLSSERAIWKRFTCPKCPNKFESATVVEAVCSGNKITGVRHDPEKMICMDLKRPADST